MKKPKKVITAFEEYVVHEMLGSGGAGSVFRATSSSGGNSAIKFLTAGSVSSQRMRRFKNEIEFCRKINHPSIVAVEDHGTWSDGGENVPFYVMPAYAGTLEDAVKVAHGSESRLKLWVQIVDAVEAAHLRKAYHRDIKPQNVLWDKAAGTVVVSDWGIAHFAEEDLVTAVETLPSERLANLLFAAPEQRVKGSPVAQTADIFALGLLLNWMFTGKVIQGVGYTRIESKDPDFAWLDGIVESMVRQEPSERPQQLREIKSALIGRRLEFVAMQRLDAARREVVKDGQPDPAEVEPIAIVNVDWNNGQLILGLSKQPRPDWIRLMNEGRWSHSAVPGAGPREIRFDKDKAFVPVRDDRAKEALTHIRNYFQYVNAQWPSVVAARVAEENRIARGQLQAKVAEAERRARVLRDLRS